MTEPNVVTPKEGFKLIPFSITLLVGLVIWFLPVPEGVKVEAWHLLAFFVATIAGIILKIMPMGAVAILGISVTALTGVLDPENPGKAIANSLSGFQTRLSG